MRPSVHSRLTSGLHVLTRAAARYQKLRHPAGRTEIRIASVRRGSPPPPRLTGDGARYVESCWHGALLFRWTERGKGAVQVFAQKEKKRPGCFVSRASILPYSLGRLSLRNHHRYSDCAAVLRLSGEALGSGERGWGKEGVRM